MQPASLQCALPHPPSAFRAFRRRRGLGLALALLVVSVIIGGCLGPARRISGGQGQTGKVHLVTPLSVGGGSDFSGAKLRLTQGILVREMMLDVKGDLLTAEIDQLPVGDWVAELDIYDLAGDVTHSATGIVRVRPGETATIRLDAQPHDGIMEIVAHIHGFSWAQEVRRARIVFQNNQSTTLKQDEDDPLIYRGAKELRPGDYDYRIELYGEEQKASDRYYQSPWESIRIYPGKTVRAIWHAAAGDVRVEMGLSRMPAQPGPLHVEITEHGYRLYWDASPDEDVTMYRVYLKKDEFAAYSARHETPADERVWAVPDNELGDETWAAVTAVTGDGRESFRSNVVYLPKRSHRVNGEDGQDAGDINTDEDDDEGESA